MADVGFHEHKAGWGFRKYWINTQVFVVLMVTWISLRWMRLPRLLDWLSSFRPSFSQDLPRLQTIAYYTDRWLTIFPYNPKGSCLPRSLVLFCFASRCGFPVKIHFGVRDVKAGLEGHAWLSLNGKPFLEKTRRYEQMLETYSFSKF